MYDISVVYLLYDTRFVPLDSFTYLSPSTSSLLATSNLFSVSVSLLQLCNYYYFLHCFLNSTCEWIHTAFTFPVCSVRVIPTNSIKVVTNSRISLLYGWVSFHFVYASVYIHVYITFFIHPPINGHRLFSYPDYCKECCRKHWNVYIFLKISFILFFR